MNLTCIGILLSEAGQLRDLPLNGDQVGDDLDGLGPLGVAVRPAGELVQVFADAGNLHGALALDGDHRRVPCSRLGHGLPQQVGRRHAGRGSSLVDFLTYNCLYRLSFLRLGGRARNLERNL